jgi:hypothetical protein
MHNIPFSKNKRCVGREKILDRLKQMLFTEDNQEAGIVGLGGVGKTQVALKFAYWVKENKPEHSIFWVPALSSKSFEQAYVEISQKLPIQKSSEDEDPKKSVHRYLSSKAAGPWLLVIDNVDAIDNLSGSENINQYLPESEDGLTLFTTRSQEVALALAQTNVVELEEMDMQEATSLFEKWLVQKDTLHNKVKVSELLRKLTCLPLAITQAAAYINRNKVSIAKYLGLLQGTEKDVASLLSREFHDCTRYSGSENAVATTWIVSFSQICKLYPAAYLLFMSCIELGQYQGPFSLNLSQKSKLYMQLAHSAGMPFRFIKETKRCLTSTA